MFLYGIHCSKTFRIVLSSWQHFKMARPQFTPQERAFIVIEYYRNNANVLRVLQRFRQEYRTTRCPSRGTVYSNVRKYAIAGTILNLN
jgi:hypothetical protein